MSCWIGSSFKLASGAYGANAPMIPASCHTQSIQKKKKTNTECAFPRHIKSHQCPIRMQSRQMRFPYPRILQHMCMVHIRHRRDQWRQTERFIVSIIFSGFFGFLCGCGGGGPETPQTHTHTHTHTHADAKLFRCPAATNIMPTATDKKGTEEHDVQVFD